METSKLRKFASHARKALIEQVGTRMKSVLAEGSLARRENAKAVADLEAKIKDIGRERTVEMVAYTWFNRFCALRYMDVNRYTKIGIVSPAEGQFQPELLAEAKMGHVDEDLVPAATREKVMRLLDETDPSDDPQGEAYRLLLVAVCNHYHGLMPFMFEKIADFTELLLPDDLLSGNSILAAARECLVASGQWSETENPKSKIENPKSLDVEVIGWLYQFYIADKKDDVFVALKKGKKITPENIPAATQLFTPHWIVRYLVENSLGRLWMLNFPQSKLRERMDYYIEPEEVDSEQWSVNSGERDGCSELSRVDRLAEVDGRGRADLSGDKEVPERGNLRTNESDSASGGIDPVQHRGGTSSQEHRGVQELSLDSSGIQSGSRDSVNDRSSSGVRDSGRSSSDSQPSRGSIKDDGISPRKTEGLSGQWTVSSGQKETDHSSLTTDHLRISSPEEIRICDPACGSGHMLTYAFDLLYAIYEEQGYNPTEIPRLILTHNLYGIEIDARAGALAAFALTMKAREKDRRFFSRPPITESISTTIENPKSKIQNPNVCVLENISVDPQELNDYMDRVGRDLFSGGLQGVVNQWEEADNFGSLIRPLVTDVSEVLELLRERQMGEDLFLAGVHHKVLKALRQADYLSPKYHVVVANPPYMGSKGMNPSVKAFVGKHYKDSKSDLFAAFIALNLDLVVENGFVGMITMQSWMFLSSFEDLRARVCGRFSISGMAHLGARAFDTIGGEVVSTTAFVVERARRPTRPGVFHRLVEGESEHAKRSSLLALIGGKATEGVFTASTKDFLEIPGAPIAYWISPELRSIFKTQQTSGDIASGKFGMSTSDTSIIHYWFEVSFEKILFNAFNPSAFDSATPFAPYDKGGTFRRWYGNRNHIINWKNDGAAVRGNKRAAVRNSDMFCKPHVSWTLVASGAFSVREFEAGFLLDTASNAIYLDNDEQRRHHLAALNSSVVKEVMPVLNPTMNFSCGVVDRVPIADSVNAASLASECVRLSKADWDSMERSWDFTSSPLLLPEHNLELAAQCIRQTQIRDVETLHELEREINKSFSSAYGLEDIVQTFVDIKDVSLTCNPAYRYDDKKSDSELEALLLSDTMREFISYAVGCMLGRYSLDKSGLILANQGETAGDYRQQIPEPTFAPDEDNVIPMLDGDWFTDDITERFKEFLKVTFGTEHYEENLTFLENALYPENSAGKKRKTIRDYFLKEFYDHHIKLYKKRPIYWLFSSPKGTFNALIYMHRYRPDTVSTVLQYLRDFRDKLAHRRDHLQAVADSGSASQSDKTKALKEVATLKKQLKELEDYETETLFPLAQKKIDNGVKHNYPLFGNALKKVTGLS